MRPVDFRRSAIIGTVVVVLIGLLAFAVRNDAAVWFGSLEKIESADGATLYLDTQTIHKQNGSASFWTRVRSDSVTPRIVTEPRMHMRIDCQTTTYQEIEGGMYIDGRKSAPFGRLKAGPIPKQGYIKKLYDRVC